MTDKFKVHIGNLSFKTEKESLVREFSACGTITDVSMPLDRETNRPRGFAFITFETADGQKNGLAKHDMKLDGRNIKVSAARPSTQGSGPRGFHDRNSSHSNQHDHYGDSDE